MASNGERVIVSVVANCLGCGKMTCEKQSVKTRKAGLDAPARDCLPVFNSDAVNSWHNVEASRRRSMVDSLVMLPC